MKISKNFILETTYEQSQFFQTKEEIENWLNEYGIKNFIINDDLTVDVNGDVDLSSKKYLKFLVKFRNISGNFYCSKNQLTSLQGAPQEVGEDFVCNENQLTSLQGAPQKVGGGFVCNENQLTSLQGAPQKVGGGFMCGGNQLTSLQGAPQEVGGNFYCSDNQLTSLQGAPQKVGGNFYCRYNQLTSLQGAPQEVGEDFVCSENQLTSLQGAPQKVGEDFMCSENQLTSLQGAPQEVGRSFYCSENQLTSLQGAPQKVGGSFYCRYNQLTSLQGAPQKVGGSFYCSKNRLTSLQGAPQEVGGDFVCNDNQLTSLQGAPQEVGGGFMCSGNQLTSLQGAPQEVGGDFYCNENQLTSLQGAPQEVGGDFYVDDKNKSELKKLLDAINKPKPHKNIINRKYNISSPTLYNIALQISKKYEDDYKIPIKDLKKEMNLNNYLGQLLTKKDGQNFLKKYSNGFSINDIKKYDEENKIINNKFLNSLKIGTDLEIDFDVWKGSQIIFKEKNYVFQLNFSKEITEKLISDSSDDKYTISGEHEGVYHEIETSNKNNLKSYIKNSNHPTSKELLTMGWIRFTLFPNEEYLVIDEIQTDLDDKDFLGQQIMDGWEDILMNAFIKYARNDLNYQKIYMPTYQTKLDRYSANPPMRLYKELPNRFGFKTKSDLEGFLVLEKKIISFIQFISLNNK